MSANSGFRAQLLIDGAWTGADSGRTVGVENPATEEILAQRSEEHTSELQSH